MEILLELILMIFGFLAFAKIGKNIFNELRIGE
jgi:hypothetical protein